MQVEEPLSYWITVARLGFENDLARLMEKGDEQGPITRSDVAKAIGRSPAFVTKTLNSQTNYTLTTMVRFARALGAVLEVRLAHQTQEVVRVLDIETATRLAEEQMQSARQETGKT
jgi:plasmid maintenance system antidote protein VapI